MNDLRVESRFKNARLYRAMMAQFEHTARQHKPSLRYSIVGDVITLLGASSGISTGHIRELLNLKNSPFSRNKAQYREAACKIANALCESPEELFPRSLYELALPNVLIREYASPELLSLQAASRMAIEPPQEQAAIESEKREQIAEALHRLKPRSEKILKLRFGLDGNECHTLEEIGKIFGVTGQRIREIEAKGLRDLLHPSISHNLRNHL